MVHGGRTVQADGEALHISVGAEDVTPGTQGVRRATEKPGSLHQSQALRTAGDTRSVVTANLIG